MNPVMESAVLADVDRIYDVPGFVGPLDVELFARLFELQDETGVGGDVLEIGSFFGRSALLLEYLKDEQEVLHVCDLFEATPPTEAGRDELAAFSGDMPTRSDFEEMFRSFEATVPVIHQQPSSELNANELGPNRFRFVHVDGSHVYDAVASDIELACDLATDGGVVAFDDFANVGHPGVAAAVWPAVMERDLEPFVCSPSKLYATRGSDRAARYRDAVWEFATVRGYESKLTEIPESTILSVWSPPVRRSVPARVARRLRRIARHALGASPAPFIPEHILGF
jgi:methyltransferase family protein